jgi:hypothetical protein
MKKTIPAFTVLTVFAYTAFVRTAVAVCGSIDLRIMKMTINSGILCLRDSDLSKCDRAFHP